MVTGPVLLTAVFLATHGMSTMMAPCTLIMSTALVLVLVTTVYAQ